MSDKAPWRTTPFRLALAFGVAYVVGVCLLLGVVYLQTEAYLNRRVDGIINAEVAVLKAPDAARVADRLQEEGGRDPLNAFALYGPDGRRLAGRSPIRPEDLPDAGRAREFGGAGARGVRALKASMPGGGVLVASRDISQVVALRGILIRALIASGSLIVLLGLLAGSLLGREPLRRVGQIRAASRNIIAGDLGARLPVSRRGDEIDELASIVNAMLDEVERLVRQAETAGESIAHELRTPLTRLRAALEEAVETMPAGERIRARLETCVAEADGVLARFRALLRIAAVEARRRRSSMRWCDLSAMTHQVGELYAPLAEERGLGLGLEIQPGLEAEVDADLFFEAMANLLDNALKFTPQGGAIRVSLKKTPEGLLLEVADNGRGVSPGDLPLITKRFYRASEHHAVAGHGLGLSLVAAVTALHAARFTLADNAPGLKALILLPDVEGSGASGPPVRPA